MHFGQPVLEGGGTALFKALDAAGRRIEGKRFVGFGSELADLSRRPGRYDPPPAKSIAGEAHGG